MGYRGEAVWRGSGRSAWAVSAAPTLGPAVSVRLPEPTRGPDEPPPGDRLFQQHRVRLKRIRVDENSYADCQRAAPGGQPSQATHGSKKEDEGSIIMCFWAPAGRPMASSD